MKIASFVVVDCREQAPFRFEKLPAKPGTLDTGDYTIRGLTHLIAVERKSLNDLLTCVGRDRDRFNREQQRLHAYPFRLLVVDANAAVIEAGDWRSQLVPPHVLGSLAAWMVQYGLPVSLAGSHEAAGRFIEKFLYQSARAIAAEVQAVGITEDAA